MKSRQLFPHEMKGLNTDDKTGILNRVGFQWKVDITYIKSNLKGQLQRLKK